MRKSDEPKPISAAQQRARLRRIATIGIDLGFVGSLEYRHVYSQSGGAQYCVGPSTDADIIIVYAEAFERDADPDDFSLEAIIAHECGHQRLAREANLREVLGKLPGDQIEEVLASLVGSILLGKTEAAQMLVWKATAELGEMGISAASTARFIERLRKLMRDLL